MHFLKIILDYFYGISFSLDSLITAERDKGPKQDLNLQEDITVTWYVPYKPHIAIPVDTNG